MKVYSVMVQDNVGDIHVTQVFDNEPAALLALKYWDNYPAYTRPVFHTIYGIHDVNTNFSP